MHNLPFALNTAGDGQHAGGEDDAALLFEQFRPDDEIGDAGLVFDGDEHHAFGASRASAGRGQARRFEPAPVARLHRLGAGADALPRRSSRRNATG